jgi:hypothetical protein
MPFIKIEEAVDVVIQLAQDGMIEDHVLTNDPHLRKSQEYQQAAIDTVHDFFTNNVFD